MTEHDIIRIARDSGIDWFRIPSAEQALLEKFAKAIAAEEREACAKYIAERYGWDTNDIRTRDEQT